MNKKVYREPRTFEKYDRTHIIGYLNETIIENYQPEQQEGQEPIEPYTGYQYEGVEPDGGTIMECADAGDTGEVVNAIIRTRYTLSQELAIHRHHENDAATYAKEWEEYDDWCETAKTVARNWLNK